MRIARVLAMVTAFLVVAPTAHADEAAARAHFRKGVDLYDRKQYAAALESFRAAYAEKPSAGIKQNIGLSLKGLGQPIDAATAFDEALDEGSGVMGEGTLKPEVRAAMEQELAALSKVVATVRLKVISVADKQPIENVVVTVDGNALTPAALRRPVRLEPGIHVFTAHADGLADPPQKKLSILAGSPVDATFELGVPQGLLTVRASVPDAVVQIDGAEVGRGTWSGKLSAGTHRVTVSAPDFQTTTADVIVSSGASIEYPMTLLRTGDLPPVYNAPARRAPPELKRRYVVPMLAYEAQSLTLSDALGERPQGTKRSFAGAAIGVRAGYRLSRGFGLELLSSVGQTGSTYAISSAAAQSSTTVTHFELVPALRFVTNGAVRFTVGTGVGLHDTIVSADIHTATGLNGAQSTHKSYGLSATWLVDLGMQIDIGPTFLEIVGVFDTYGVGTARDDRTNARFFLASPSTRGGLRVGLGLQF
ncbi:MAG: hypothetical protein JWO86_5365 [Myxococcaceae bacterium]|nr:hypothetical protein [Myxococcaceae bacterium]